MAFQPAPEWIEPPARVIPASWWAGWSRVHYGATAAVLAAILATGCSSSTLHPAGGALVFKGGAQTVCAGGIREAGETVTCYQGDGFIRFRAADVVATKYFYEKRIDRPTY